MYFFLGNPVDKVIFLIFFSLSQDDLGIDIGE